MRLCASWACVSWMCFHRLNSLIDGQKRQLGYPRSVPPRYFVFYWCRFLEEQQLRQRALTVEEAMQYVQSNNLPDSETANAAEAQ